MKFCTKNLLSLSFIDRSTRNWQNMRDENCFELRTPPQFSISASKNALQSAAIFPLITLPESPLSWSASAMQPYFMADTISTDLPRFNEFSTNKCPTIPKKLTFHISLFRLFWKQKTSTYNQNIWVEITTSVMSVSYFFYPRIDILYQLI